jgi:Bacterial toxin 3/Domain of unknown function (DUF4157)
MGSQSAGPIKQPAAPAKQDSKVRSGAAERDSSLSYEELEGAIARPPGILAPLSSFSIPTFAPGEDGSSTAPAADPDLLRSTLGLQARPIEVIFGSARAARAPGMTLDGRVHIRARTLDQTNFSDRLLLGHELAHAIQQQRGATLSGRTLQAHRRRALEAEADHAALAMASGRPFNIVESAPAGAALFRDAQKIRKLTLLRDRGLMIVLLEDGTRESVQLYYNGKPNPGAYTFDTATSEISPESHSTRDSNGNVIVFWKPLDALYEASGAVPLVVIDQSSFNDDRIQARPELSEAVAGTRITYWIATPPQLGGSYQYQWWCENDPSEARQRGQPSVVVGPTESKWDTVWEFPGRHTIVCEVTDLNSHTKQRLEFYQKVRAEAAIVDEVFDQAKAPDYDRFRAGLELKNLDLMQGGLQDQSGDGKLPFISCAGDNPAVPGMAPDLAYNTYTVTPSPGAKKFRWYAIPQNWDGLPPSYYGYSKATFGNIDAYDLAKDSPSARFIIADSRIWTIVCEEFDGSGQALGTKARYRQVIFSAAAAGELAKWRAYVKRTDAAVAKIVEGKALGLRAAYVNRETGQTLPLELYAGPSADGSGKVMLLDLLPGVDKVEYSGATIDDALADFDTNNSYPKGTIKLEVPANTSGIPTRSRTLDTKGESDWALWSSRVGWASFGLVAAGVVSGLIPGGQPVAAAFFIAAGATGAASGGLSLYDRLQKAEVNPAGVALDVANIAANMIGAAGAIRLLSTGSRTLALAGNTGRFLLYSGFVTNTVSGLIISVEGIDQVIKILDSPMSRGEKLSALVRVLGTLILQGVLFVLSVREVRQIRSRIGDLIGKELSQQLPNEVLHSLNLLDDKALRALGGSSVEQLTQVATLARVDASLANRLASIPGLSLSEHELGIEAGTLALDGQIKLDPAKLAALSDAEVKQLMRVTKALKAAGGDLGRLTEAEKKLLEDLSKSSGQRLRFDAQLKKVDQFLSDIGAASDPRAPKLFGDMSEAERRRLYDLVSGGRSGSSNLSKQAADFALGRASSVAEFVELFESYAAKYAQTTTATEAAYRDAVNSEMQARIAANPSMSPAERGRLLSTVQKDLSKTWFGQEIDGFGTNFKKALAVKVENDLGVPGDPTRAGSGATQVQATLDANKAALVGRIGPAGIGSGLNDNEAIAKIKALPEVKFGTDTSASYHVEKHSGELPPGEVTGDKATDFLASANKTIQTGATAVNVDQGGSRRVFFTRQVSAGGRQYTMTAIVSLTTDGKASLASYMGIVKATP